MTEDDEDTSHPDYTSPQKTLLSIGSIIETLNLTRTLPIGYEFYRVRLGNEEYTSFDDISVVQNKNANSNRMSPAGIAMLYAAKNIDTALSETWDGEHQTIASIGKFRLTREISVIDFTSIPEVPSFWSEVSRQDLDRTAFLHEFVKDLSKPATRGNKIDTHYAPTQIVSEYLLKVRAENNGIMFNSSINGGLNLALNLLHTEDREFGKLASEYIELLEVEHRPLKKELSD